MNDFNSYYFSHARTALKYGLIGLKINEGSEVFLPDYICDVVLHPIEELKLKPVFYPTFEDLTTKWEFLEKEITFPTSPLSLMTAKSSNTP